MTLRYARHTADLNAIRAFYTEILGFTCTGGFEDHAGYHGLFFGKPGLPWHLEFTHSPEAPQHNPDPDDLLVLYPDTLAEYESIRERIQAAGIPLLQSRNPYWHSHSIHFQDPDGYGLIVSQQKAV